MGRPTKKQQRYKNVGRKLFDGKDKEMVLQKLEEAARIDAPVEEMCFYADISVRAFYDYCEKNPKFLQRINQLKERVPLKARQNIVGQIESGDIGLSKWILERKKPTEFSETLQLKHSGGINIDDNEEISPEDQSAIDEFHNKLKENLVKRSLERAKQEGEL